MMEKIGGGRIVATRAAKRPATMPRMAQWIHFPEISVNLDNVAYIVPGPDNLFKLYFASFDIDNEQTAI